MLRRFWSATVEVRKGMPPLVVGDDECKRLSPVDEEHDDDFQPVRRDPGRALTEPTAGTGINRRSMADRRLAAIGKSSQTAKVCRSGTFVRADTAEEDPPRLRGGGRCPMDVGRVFDATPEQPDR
jgi:hypothetical protein